MSHVICKHDQQGLNNNLPLVVFRCGWEGLFRITRSVHHRSTDGAIKSKPDR